MKTEFQFPPASFRSRSPGSPRCHFLHRRSLPGLVFQSPSLVLTEPEPEPWLTSKQKPSWSKLRGQQRRLRRLPPPLPLLEGPSLDLAPGADKALGRDRPPKEGAWPQLGPERLERAPPWDWQTLEAGEVRETFYPVAQSHSLLVALEHNYSKPPQCLPPLPAEVPAPPFQPT